jgi:hypothetical protein
MSSNEFKTITFVKVHCRGKKSMPQFEQPIEISPSCFSRVSKLGFFYLPLFLRERKEGGRERTVTVIIKSVW